MRMPRNGWVEQLRVQLSEGDREDDPIVQFTFQHKPQWRAAEMQRGIAYALGEEFGYNHLSRHFDGGSMIWTFTR